MCVNHKKDDKESCSFMIGSIASVRLKEAQVKELLTKKKTEVISGFVAKTGMKFDAPLKLTEEGEIAFDFPEKPKPEETTVPCPKCGKMLMKTQWRYECVCGFKIWHTVAKVELSEEVMKELLTTGKTKQKIAGFTSKAGNTFDTCLKYENEAYGALKAGLPDNGERVRTPDGPGIVVDTNVLREQVKVRLFLDNEKGRSSEEEKLSPDVNTYKK